MPFSFGEFWRKGLEEYQTLVYTPLSSGLSGSCNTAMMLANEPEFAGKVYVVDNGQDATCLKQ